jgi:hypothetical protein
MGIQGVVAGNDVAIVCPSPPIVNGHLQWPVC